MVKTKSTEGVSAPSNPVKGGVAKMKKSPRKTPVKSKKFATDPALEHEGREVVLARLSKAHSSTSAFWPALKITESSGMPVKFAKERAAREASAFVLVRWLGYRPTSYSWLKEQDIVSYKDNIQKYMKKSKVYQKSVEEADAILAM
ncbi:hypothetical protein FVE85_1165 [Porphyridium purpureum]|uniref:PWWP domain-containing protein n=1 Tax=Porphyridium purpureum TaxID=35688 RepID=A0A5J4Z1D4_PORPP|nr:hypothetical protein FVE85_1165 [Porphyridium purpureum]|eukprot:POR9618..scf208_2